MTQVLICNSELFYSLCVYMCIVVHVNEITLNYFFCFIINNKMFYTDINLF